MAFGIERNDNRHVFAVAGFFGFCQVHRNLSGADEGRSRQDDHQQDEHDVDERDDVDLIKLAIHASPYTEPQARSRVDAACCSTRRMEWPRAIRPPSLSTRGSIRS